VAIDRLGKPSFQVLQNRKALSRGWILVYYAFDLLNFEGEDLTQLPLTARKAKLKRVLGSGAVRYNAELPGSPAAIIQVVRSAGLEGVIAKRRDSTYQAGTRVNSWLKLKLDKSQEFVIGGYKPKAGSFEALLTGYYENRRLVFSGKVRNGFGSLSRATRVKMMQPLITAKCPFTNLPGIKKGRFGEGITAEDMESLVWLKPKLVAQCAFTEWTNSGMLRHPTFRGLRDDKEANDVVREG